MTIESTGNPELAEESGDTGDDAVLAALIAKSEPVEQE